MINRQTKSAVCIGINDYTGTANDLRGCINDAHDWADHLGERGYEVTRLLDDQATHDGILGALETLISAAGPGDSAVLTYSGHGTWIPDNGELDESDNRDEALAVHDGLIIDDEIRGMLRKLDPEATLTIISDSCHSGSVTRAYLMDAAGRARSDAASNPPVPRFLPPENDRDALAALMLPVRRRAFYPETEMNHVLLTGCNAMEYSYDAYFNGRYNGAMTYFALELLRGNPEQSWSELHVALRQLLPSTQYPQSPQLEGSEANKNRPVFG